MKKINNKGFTLVELLAVLVILIIILTTAIPSITASVERNKKNFLGKKTKIIEVQAEAYANLYKNKFNYNAFKSGSCCITIEMLKNTELLTDDDTLDADGKEIKGGVCYTNKKYEYENTVTGCVVNE